MLDYGWRLLLKVGEHLSGFGLGYNSYGALASVNHLHFQCFQRVEELPVESARWRHNGGTEIYPGQCHRLGTIREVWELLDQLHASNCAYNLLLRPGAAYVLPRRLQGSYPSSPWAAGHAWYEMAGGVVVTRRQTLGQLCASDLASEIAKVTVNRDSPSTP